MLFCQLEKSVIRNVGNQGSASGPHGVRAFHGVPNHRRFELKPNRKIQKYRPLGPPQGSFCALTVKGETGKGLQKRGKTPPPLFRDIFFEADPPGLTP